MSDTGLFVSVPVAAGILGKSPEFVRELIESGRLPAHVFGSRKYSVRKTDLDDFIGKSRCVSGADSYGDFLDVAVNSSDPLIRETARKLLDERR